MSETLTILLDLDTSKYLILTVSIGVVMTVLSSDSHVNLSSECRTSDILWLREPLSPEQLLSPNLVFDCQDVRTVWKAESDMMRERIWINMTLRQVQQLRKRLLMMMV